MLTSNLAMEAEANAMKRIIISSPLNISNICDEKNCYFFSLE
jgi:hypothetical protein